MKRGNLSIAEYLAQIKRLCDLLSASGHTLLDNEQVHVVLVGLSIEFESMITMATFSLVPLSIERLVEMLLECGLNSYGSNENIGHVTLFPSNVEFKPASFGYYGHKENGPSEMIEPSLHKGMG
ncbi:hypothetical protein PVK06_040120 [Gossypium arboreum]|uniref:Uncharacterized protein n=1 Tax=Gossypium arboreum TaxID=29729 RepID=A0ABR0N4M9_GOSAR|nr:hypothetical protein PVK06_040120 [Gossypium arboreum]